jgi:hypothetical protein
MLARGAGVTLRAKVLFLSALSGLNRHGDILYDVAQHLVGLLGLFHR